MLFVLVELMVRPVLAVSHFKGTKAYFTDLRSIPIRLVLSAKPRSMCDRVIIVPFLCIPNIPIAPMSEMLNNQFENASYVTNEVNTLPAIRTLDIEPSSVTRISLISFAGKPCTAFICHSSFNFTESYAAINGFAI